MRFLVCTAMVAGLVAVASASCAQPVAFPPKEGFGPPPSSDQLRMLPQTRGAKGDQERHYYFADGQAEMPYRLYVPASYDPKVATPLIVALHGYGGNQDYFFALVSDLKALCDRYGFIFVAPMGYTTGNWYGAPMDVPRGAPPGANGQPNPVPPGLLPGPPDGPRERALSEKDVMNVLAIVRGEYNVDPRKIYLMGHSMGGAGTWSIALKYPEIWAAIAPLSGTLSEVDYDYARLQHTPVLVSVGGMETGLVHASKAELAAMEARGMKASYQEISGATHMSMIPAAVPKVFAFFSEQQKP